MSDQARIPLLLQVGAFITTLGAWFPMPLCRDCGDKVSGFGVVGLLILVVAVIASAIIAFK
jgi:hypothetical protein